jgi:phosphohistidine phosphatase
VSDEERPLSGRGRRDARAAGEWIASHGLHPDAVLCSPAARTRETWARVAPGLETTGPLPDARFEDAIYEATVSALEGVLRELPEEAGTALLIGHNPGVHDLVVALADQGDERARTLAAASFPTSGVAVLELSEVWSELVAGSAKLQDFAVPRG